MIWWGICYSGFDFKTSKHHEGIGKAPTVRVLKALVREESPDIVFLAEAKVKIARFERIKRSIDFVGFHCVEAVGGNKG